MLTEGENGTIQNNDECIEMIADTLSIEDDTIIMNIQEQKGAKDIETITGEKEVSKDSNMFANTKMMNGSKENSVSLQQNISKENSKREVVNNIPKLFQRKTFESIAAEKAIDYLYKKGKLPKKDGYDYLTEDNNSPMKYNKNNSISQKSYNPMKAFLERNQARLSKKHLNLTKNVEKNGMMMNNFLLSSPKTQHCYTKSLSQSQSPVQQKTTVKGLKHGVSNERFTKAQAEFLVKKQKKIEDKRQQLQIEINQETKAKPTINENSKKMMQRAYSACNKDKKAIHNKLYEDRKIMTIKRNELTSETNKRYENLVKSQSQRNITKQDVDCCINKLYKEGVEQLKKRDMNTIPCHMEEVSHFYSRDFSSYQSNIRTNMTKSCSMQGMDSIYDLSKGAQQEKETKNNKMIFTKTLIQDIDTSLKKIIELDNKIFLSKEEKEICISEINTSKEYITFRQYCQLLFYIGMIQYNHIHFCDMLKNKPDQTLESLSKLFCDSGHFINYDMISIDKINIDEMIVKSIPSKGKVSKEMLSKEYRMILYSWILLTNEQAPKGTETILLDQFKLFCLIIIGVYSGDIINDNNKPTRTLSASSPSTKTNTKTKPQTVNEYINSKIIKNLPEINFDKQTALFITSHFDQFNRNHSLFKNTLRKEKSKQKLTSCSSNPQMTFKPAINPSSKVPRNYSICEQNYSGILQKRRNNIEKLQRDKEIDELKPCTFLPNNKTVSKNKSREISNRLFSTSLSKNDKDILAQKQKEKLQLQMQECTFAPEIHGVDGKVFHKQNVLSHPSVSLKIEQYEKARIEKKLVAYVQKQGGLGLTKIMTSDDLVSEFHKEDNLGSFKFGIEHKTNKETFDSFSSKQSDKNTFVKHPLLFTIEVKINGKVESLKYHQGDSPNAIISQFCKKHNLGQNSHKKILTVIENKLKC